MSTDNIMRDLKSALSSGLQESVNMQITNAKQLSPVDTGKLKSSWKSTVSGTTAKVSNDTPYAEFQEMGTSRQSGREMIGWRSQTIGTDIARRIKF